MSEIKVGENETLESALRRFKRKCARAGVLSEVRKREHYEVVFSFLKVFNYANNKIKTWKSLGIFKFSNIISAILLVGIPMVLRLRTIRLYKFSKKTKQCN